MLFKRHTDTYLWLLHWGMSFVEMEILRKILLTNKQRKLGASLQIKMKKGLHARFNEYRSFCTWNRYTHTKPFLQTYFLISWGNETKISGCLIIICFSTNNSSDTDSDNETSKMLFSHAEDTLNSINLRLLVENCLLRLINFWSSSWKVKQKLFMEEPTINA